MQPKTMSSLIKAIPREETNEIISLAIKTIVNFSLSWKPYLRYFLKFLTAISLDLHRESITKNDVKVLIMSKEILMIISYRISITNNTCIKFGQKAFLIKIDAFWSCAINDADLFVNLKTIFNTFQSSNAFLTKINVYLRYSDSPIVN